MSTISKQYKLFPYSGNKLWFVNQFNELTKNTKTIIEPFAGSAAISLNSNVDNIYINDFDKNIVTMFKAVQEASYKDYMDIFKKVKEDFGDIRESKEAYYEYRNWFNKNFYNNESVSSNYTAGIHLLILAGAVINSMLRFSKNGMNQSWGHRQFIIDEESWNHFKQLNVIITNYDFFSSLYQKLISHWSMSNKDVVVFMDPPYEFREMSYNRGFGVNQFIDTIKSKDFCPNATLMYTDFNNDVSDELLNHGWTKTIIREMKSTSPNRKNENKTGDEVLFIRNPL
jgi:site-specific DNA-adenine methylase